MLPPSRATCVPRVHYDHHALALQYGCLGYSVHPDRSKLGVTQLQARVPPDTAELPYCQGVQVCHANCCECKQSAGDSSALHSTFATGYTYIDA